MNSKTYISDPKMWGVFYKNMAEKKFSPYKYKPRQIGRGMRKQNSYAIPIRPHSQLDNQIAQVTPVAAVEERAKTEHLKDVKEGVPYVKVTKGIKKLKPATSNYKKKKSKKSSLGKKKKLITKKKKTTNGKSRKRQTKVKKSSSKLNKSFKIDSYKNIFKQ